MSDNIEKYINTIRGKNIHIIGASGSEGTAIAEFLIDNNINQITLHDFQPDLRSFRHRFKQTHTNLSAQERSKKLKKIINSKVKLNLKENYLQNIHHADLIFLTQAWYLYPPNFPHLQKAIDMKIPVSSLTKLYFDLTPCPIIGITGSNGKTTTTTIITKILQAGGYKVFTSGNERSIYEQILPQIRSIKPTDILVLEISNRQLTIDLQSSPHIAVLTNIYPNHISEHKSYKNYQETKFSLFKYQNKNDIAIINIDNSIIKKNLHRFPAPIIPFSLKKKSSQNLYIEKNKIYYKNKLWLSISNPYLENSHNPANILAALGAISKFNISATTITKVLNNFQGIPHRLEKIAQIKGVDIIDDLKSSTPTSTISAINSFPNKNIHLIIGGNHKKVSHNLLAKIINQRIKNLYLLPGTTSNSLEKSLLNQKEKSVKIHKNNDLTDTLKLALKNTKTGDIILMSPAGANFQESHLKNKYSLKSILERIYENPNN